MRTSIQELCTLTLLRCFDLLESVILKIDRVSVFQWFKDMYQQGAARQATP